ncbi:MAG: hypothetical protein ABIO70_31015 [Pseudomonadota bacterium]
MHPLHILSVALLPGCIIAIAPAVQEAGRVLPDTTAGAGEVCLDGDWGRNLTEGAGVNHAGDLEAADGTPGWPAWGLTYRQGLGKGLGLEGRISGSFMLPLPAPVPNGLSLAPMVRVAKWGEHLELHTLPRFAYLKGYGFIGLNEQYSSTTRAFGLDVPAVLSWQPRGVFAATGTLWLRGYRVWQRADYDPGAGDLEEGTPGAWTTFGSGTSVNLFLSPGHFRVGLGGGVEWAPNPGRNVPYADRDAIPPGGFWFPEVGMSLGFDWGGGEG